MMVQMTLVGPMFGQFVHFMRFAPKGNDYALDRHRTQVRRVLTTLEERLCVVPFLGGQSYSIADIATFPRSALFGQPGRGRLLDADGLGRDNQQPTGGNTCPNGGRRSAGQDHSV
jgi:glutathione S-transferase